MNGEKKKILIGAAVIIAIWAIWGLVQKANAKKYDVKDASPKYYVTKVSIPTPCSQNPQLQTVKKRSFRLSWGSSRNQCFLGSTYCFAFQQFYPKNNCLLNVFSISDVNYLPFAVVLYVDGMMTAMLIGCVFSMLEKNGKIVLALSLVGVNDVWGSGVFEIEKHNAFTSFLLGIESMIKGMNPVHPAIIYAIVSISLCLLVIKRFKLRFE
ncbi:hypothetical protein [Ligilactobacillus ruminis]|uniref:hypothetical protein n=1 Tax=Ligilactobacillus ruminis TaxID=1623 RepID=UPI003F9D2BA6